MARFRHHKYTWEKPFGSERHLWQFVGPQGGVHFTANIVKDYGPSCGLEFHHAASTGYRCDEAPDDPKCWLLGQPCRHDGTSLYATETIWPMIEPCLRAGNHEAVFTLLEAEYEDRFRQFATPAAMPDGRHG